MTHFFQITVAQQSVLLLVFLLENGRNIKDRIDNEGCVLWMKKPKAEIWIYSDSNEPNWLTQQIEIGMLHNVVNSWLNS